MKQKLKDLALLIKNDRKYQVIFIACLLALLWGFFHQPDTRVAKKKPEQTLGTGSAGSQETVSDLLGAFKGEFESLKVDSIEQRKLIDQTRKDMEENTARTGEIFKKMLERIETDNAQQALRAAQGVQQVNEDGSSVDQITALDGSDQGVEEFGGGQPQVVPPPVQQAQKTAVIGAGDSVRIKLLAGVNAPTDGTPYPVIFKLIGNVTGPDGSDLPLGEARVIAAAQGSLTDSRALFRLTTLNIRYPDGRRNVFDVDGWVVGEDGLRGMEGVLIDPIGKAIGAGMMAGGIQGLAEGFAASNVTVEDNYYGGQTTSITGSEGEYALGRALSSGASAWSRIIENRVNRLVPLVQVLSGREATAVFARTLKLPGLYDALQQDQDTFSTLD